MVRCGIDRIQEYPQFFQGKRLAMVTSVSGVTQDLRPSYAAFHERYPLMYIFSPEHGLHGHAGSNEDVQEQEIDELTGARVVSLYSAGGGKHIPPELMARLDAVVYDIQDLGTRFYTFISTMIQVMESCSMAQKEMIILDRPALLGGDIVEGGLLDMEYSSFVGPYPLCTRYGMTVGELAKMVHRESGHCCKLTVIPCEGWTRSQMFPEFGSRWVSPSSAIRDFETALLYPGICIFEGTNLSEGRGTGKPFHFVGAPFVDGERLSRAMNARNLPGIGFSPARVTPTSSKYKGQECGGVTLRVLNHRTAHPVQAGVILLYTILELWPGKVEYTSCDWSERPLISFLVGSGIFEGPLPPLEELLAKWEENSAAFRQRKLSYHIYP